MEQSSEALNERHKILRSMCDIAHRLSLTVRNKDTEAMYIEDISIKVVPQVETFRSYRSIGTIYWRVTLGRSSAMRSTRYIRNGRGEIVGGLFDQELSGDVEQLAWEKFEECWLSNPRTLFKSFVEGNEFILKFRKDDQIVYQVI